jgi:hypothetical protein
MPPLLEQDAKTNPEASRIQRIMPSHPVQLLLIVAVIRGEEKINKKS